MLKKIKFSFLILVTAIWATACGDVKDDIGVEFPVTFRATFDNEDMVKGQEYFLGNLPLFFESCRMYVSDITLLQGSKQIQLSEVEYLDFTPQGSQSPYNTIRFKNVPPGNYDGLRIGFGVKPVLNAKSPSNFPFGHPLAEEVDYWSAWKSYIFSVFDGKADPENDGTKNLTFSYHSGSNPVYKVFDFSYPIQVQPSGPTTLVTLDVKELFTTPDGSFFDIVNNPATSNSASDVTVAQTITANFGRAISLSQ